MQKKRTRKTPIEVSDKGIDSTETRKITRTGPGKGRLMLYLLRSLVVISILGLSGTSFYYYQQYRKIKISPEVAAQSENKQIVDKISVFMVLPEGEEPTIATVSDRKKLSEKDFFKKSENGDKILIYAEAKKAILYRPSLNKVIEVAPLLMDQKKTEESMIKEKEKNNKEDNKEVVTVGRTEKLNVSIKNGTQTAGLAAEAETKLISIDGINIYEKSNTIKDDYKETLVIDLSEENDQLTAEIATAVEGRISTLPEDESVSEDVDILVIIGE